MEKFRNRWTQSGSMLCVGLDPVLDRIPTSIRNGAAPLRTFNQEIIQATSKFACCYKPNLGFYLPFGVEGIEALMALREDVPSDIPLLLDAKVGDIDTTSEAYAIAYFDRWGFDGVTAQAYLGHDSLEPLLARTDKAVFVLAKTSNAGSGFLQDIEVNGQPVSSKVALAACDWNTAGNVGLVVGATYPEQLETIRSQIGDMPVLVPGIGAQQGDLDAAIRAGLDSNGYGLLVNASRAICFASSGDDFAEAAHDAARNLRDRIERARTSVMVEMV